jgi:N-methylhydantoinase A/oxoprolinase/acetone carboxylase beta subunit
VCTDVGGTSFDVAVVTAGRPEVTETPTIDKQSYKLTKVAVASVAAGGGSIAHVDDSGILHVGPESAGSNPGPACYGRGGTEPTVTDADLLLGYLSPDGFAGGGLTLETALAERAVAPIAAAMHCSTVAAAAAVVRIANARMADLVRKHTIEYGRDPADFVLYIYGGAGAVHGASFAEELRIKRVVFVANAGVFSAFGMTTSDIIFTQTASALYRAPFQPSALKAIEGQYEALADRIQHEFTTAGVNRQEVQIQRYIRARFPSQANEVEMEISGSLNEASLQTQFVGAYEATYGPGTAFPEAGLELVTLRVVGRLPTGRLSLEQEQPWCGASVSDAISAHRPMFDLTRSAMVTGTVYDGAKLATGHEVLGPAVP